MVFKCQEDSFLKEYTAKVVSCQRAKLYWSKGEATGKELHGFNVILNDTILFPEGGGQRCDYGTIDGKPVRRVLRKGSKAVHFVESTESFEVGTEVKLKLDWERRVDHMQQHSGQHLITALFYSAFNYDTTSWWMGTETSYIELNTTNLIVRESLDFVERTARALIIEGRKISVEMVRPEKVAEDAHAPRGLPKDHVDLARVVRIEGIKSNMCCGTHVSNISQLQTIKLLYAEKTKNNVKIHFVVGERVLKKLTVCYQREMQLNMILKSGPTQHLELIEKLQSSLKNARNGFQKLLKEIAIAEAQKLLNMPEPRPKYYSLHRKDGIEMDFINTFLRNAPEDVFYFLTVCDDAGMGIMVLRGVALLVRKFGPLFTEILEGKGIGKENNFQAKITNGGRIDECEVLLKEF